MKNEEPQKRPYNTPPGYLSLWDAFLFIGRAAIGSWWAGSVVGVRDVETAIAEMSLPPILEFPRDNPPSDMREHLQGLSGAKFYTRDVALCLSAAARSGAVPTFYAKKGAGELEAMPVGAWRTDNEFLRFQGWSFDPDDYSATGYDLPCWVFVEAAAFSRLEASLRSWRERLPQFVGQPWNPEMERFQTFVFGRAPVEVMGDETLFISPPRFPIMPALRSVEASQSNVHQIPDRGEADLPNSALAPRQKATRAELRAWIRERITAGDTQTAVGQTFRKAIPGKSLDHYSREAVRQLYQDEHIDMKGQAKRPGPA